MTPWWRAVAARRLSTSARPPPPLKDWWALAAYDPATVERGWYDWWRETGVFEPRATNSAGREHRMLWPPANVTGSLHIGHALTASVQDAVVRWRRMHGDAVRWVPGSDHAGIATQTVVERRMWQQRGQTRHDVGREAMLREIWDWCDAHGGRINAQLRDLGASMDWRSEYFTRDAARSEFVALAFLRLFEQGLVYRATRMVNWCCHLRTVLSDVEVDAVPISGRTALALPGRAAPVEVGLLHRFAYRVDGGRADEEIVVATTRLETMLADAAVAVHPNDLRYRHLHGRSVVHPFTGRRLPIVADAALVDPALGTGAVKVTPAHDFNDYECALRHGLPLETLLHPDGTLTDVAGERYRGLDRFEAREHVRANLDAAGLYRGASEQAMVLALCSRSKDLLEPMLLPQWFVRMDGMAARAASAVRTGELTIVPEHFAADWLRWLDNCRDWCISRQLWWGHRIPAFRTVASTQLREHLRGDARHPHICVADEGGARVLWVVAPSEDEARARLVAWLADALPPSAPQREQLVNEAVAALAQDEDVLDTWFSSGLLPMSATRSSSDHDPADEGSAIARAAAFARSGRANAGARTLDDLLTHIRPGEPPLALMETGADILFFWVARMVMLTQQLGGTLPFARVCLHPIVRDAQGRKMSKSLGNVIDPHDVIHGVHRTKLEETLHAAALPPAELQAGLRNVEQQFPAGIPACGSDALRFALLSYPQHARFLNLDMQRVTSARLFGNKLWNAAKFVRTNVLEPRHAFTADDLARVDAPRSNDDDNAARWLFDRWIVSRLAAAAGVVHTGFQTFQLNVAAEAAHGFLLRDFCDVYIEAFKLRARLEGPQVAAASVPTLLRALERGLRLLHPFMPYITEELWQQLVHGVAPLREHVANEPGQPWCVAVAAYPHPERLQPHRSSEAEADADVFMGVVHAVRSLRQSFKLPVTQAVPIVVGVADEAYRAREALQRHLPLLESFTKAASVQLVAPGGLELERSAVVVLSEHHLVSVGMPLMGTIKVHEHLTRTRARLASARHSIASLTQRMALPSYAAKAPETIRERDATMLAASRAELDQLEKDEALLSRVLRASAGPAVSTALPNAPKQPL